MTDYALNLAHRTRGVQAATRYLKKHRRPEPHWLDRIETPTRWALVLLVVLIAARCGLRVLAGG